MLNQGLTGPEIAEEIQLPPGAGPRPGTSAATTARSATTSRPIYQRYMGWFDGNPAHLWEHPPQAQATRYVDGHRRRAGACWQGAGLRRATATCASPPTLLKHAVFADPDNADRQGAAGRRLRATRLGRRERHLAQLLPGRRPGTAQRRQAPPAGDLAAGMAVALTDRPALRLASRSGSTAPAPPTESLAIDWHFTDPGPTLPRSRCPTAR